MRSVIKALLIIAASIVMLASLTHPASAENEPNNGEYDAQELTSGSSETGALYGNDTEDWYYVELGPAEKVTVTLELTSSSGGVWVYEIFEGDEEGGVYININVDPGYSKGEDFYTNDEIETIKLFLRVAGDGDYRMSVKMSGGSVCCSGLVFFGGFSILAVFLGTLLIAHRRRQRSAIGSDLPTQD